MASIPSRTTRRAPDPAPRVHRILSSNTPRPVELWPDAPRRVRGGKQRILNVPQDVYDLRDRRYLPMLRPLRPTLDHRARVPKIYDQEDEGACTGFAMAAVVNLLLGEQGRPLVTSPRFLYENAKRYDEWKGEEYEGSSIRGAMKGFQKHGVCSWARLPYVAKQHFTRLPESAVKDALERPLGAYFRVTTSSVNDLQSALSEAGAVLASANVHSGWDEPTKPTKGLARIQWRAGMPLDGGHAFALVGYTDEGFIVQNSWGREWGSRGFALLTYEDWLNHRMDAWVAQMGVGRVDYARPDALPKGLSIAGKVSVSEPDIHGHYLAIRNGDFDTYGEIHSYPEDLDDIASRFANFAKKQRMGKAAKVMLWAHGGLVGEDGAAERTRDLLKPMLDAGVYPIHFIWHTGLAEELSDILFGKSPRSASTPGEAPVRGWLKDKLQNAKDGILEVAARPLGKAIWSEMKTDASDACRGRGAASPRPAFGLLDRLKATGLKIEYHLVGHSAGSIFHCHLFDWFVRNGVRAKTCSYLAPAVTTDLFQRTIQANAASLGAFYLHTMADKDECEDHCGEVPGTSVGIYHKSLLYLVSYSFETASPTKLLGLARNVHEDARGRTKDTDSDVRLWLQANAKCEYYRPQLERANATLHGSFDSDPYTVRTLIKRIGG